MQDKPFRDNPFAQRRVDIRLPDLGNSRLFRLLPLVILVVLALRTAIYTVPAESEGVVLRLGRYDQTVTSGLHFKLPFGIDEVMVVPVRRQLKQEFGFKTPDASNPYQAARSSEERADEKAMVTGDLNAALVEWVIQYRIENPKDYLFNVRHADETLRDASESVMREVVGDRTVDEVITIGRQEIETEALVKLQDLVASYAMGLRIDQVQLKNVNPPERVQASFNEVNQAQQEKERAINIANGEYNKAIPRARGEAEQAISAAEGYASKRVNEARGRRGRLQGPVRRVPEGARGHARAHVPRDDGRGAAAGAQQGRSSTPTSRGCCRSTSTSNGGAFGGTSLMKALRVLLILVVACRGPGRSRAPSTSSTRPSRSSSPSSASRSASRSPRPGCNFKLPFIQKVNRIDKQHPRVGRLAHRDADARTSSTSRSTPSVAGASPTRSSTS